MVLLWHRWENPFWNLYFYECIVLLAEFAPVLIPPELWLTLGSAETHVAGQAMLPATQKS